MSVLSLDFLAKRTDVLSFVVEFHYLFLLEMSNRIPIYLVCRLSRVIK